MGPRTEPRIGGDHASERPFDDVRVEEAVALLKGFADPTRLRILLLLRGGEVRVKDLVDALAMTQSAVSHQLRALRAARLVRAHKLGRHVSYRLADDHVREILEQVLAHADEAA